MSKPSVHLLVRQASHFARWERPYYARHARLARRPSAGVHLHAFGPDTIDEAAAAPARSRSIMLFPGFGWNPYYDLEQRRRTTEVLEQSFDVVFTNPGPIARALAHLPQMVTVPFSIAVDAIGFRPRSTLDTLLHVSADYPQKDWERSRAVMEATGLTHEVFPPRGPGIEAFWPRNVRLRSRLNYRLKRFGLPRIPVPPATYVPHARIIEKYVEHDGFVHVAAPTPPFVDGLYTASMVEAGLTGALLFWHDTHQLGGTLSSVFEVPAEPARAAERILDIRASVDPAVRSRATRDEIADQYDPARAVAERFAHLHGLLDG